MILIIDLCYKKDSLSKDEFVKPISKIVEKDYEIKHYTELGNVSRYDKIIMCGTALRDHASLEDIDKFSWLKDYNGKVLGICAGFQTIAKVFGEKVIKSKEIGMVKIKADKNNVLFDDGFMAYALHSKSVESLKNFYQP
jgi:GMP synthase (glutamine-hydrolysing)